MAKHSASGLDAIARGQARGQRIQTRASEGALRRGATPEAAAKIGASARTKAAQPKPSGPSSPPNVASAVKGMGKVGAGVAKDSVNNGAVTGMMAGAFVIVAMAKWRGKANISTNHALAGGIVALMGITILYKINARIGTAFAALILIMALMEYGEPALSGLLNGAGVTSTGSNVGIQGSPIPVPTLDQSIPGDVPVAKPLVGKEKTRPNSTPTSSDRVIV